MSGTTFRCHLDDIPLPPWGLRFGIHADGRTLPGLLVRDGESVCAWRNRCAHLGLELDWVAGLFFTGDNRYLICSTHAALFDPRTGRCVHGPCVGRFLESLPVTVDGGSVCVVLPGRLAGAGD